IELFNELLVFKQLHHFFGCNLTCLLIVKNSSFRIKIIFNIVLILIMNLTWPFSWIWVLNINPCLTTLCLPYGLTRNFYSIRTKKVFCNLFTYIIITPTRDLFPFSKSILQLPLRRLQALAEASFRQFVIQFAGKGEGFIGILSEFDPFGRGNQGNTAEAALPSGQLVAVGVFPRETPGYIIQYEKIQRLFAEMGGIFQDLSGGHVVFRFFPPSGKPALFLFLGFGDFPSAVAPPEVLPEVEGDVPSAFGFPSAGVVPDPAEGPSSSGGMPASGEPPISGFPPISLGSPISDALPMSEEPLISELFPDGTSPSGSWPWMISWTFFSMADWIRPSPSDMARYSKP